MIKHCVKSAGAIALMLGSSMLYAQTASPFYMGAAVGYGSTDWSMLVTSPSSVAAASAPIGAKDKGLSYGFLAGYHITKNFAIEADYFHLRKSIIHFRAFSNYKPFNDKETFMPSKTSVYALDAKFFVPVSVISSRLKAYAQAGMGVVHRNDILADTYRIGGVFGAGFDYPLTQALTAELAFQYYTGFGNAKNVDPAYDYVPFVYQAYGALTYRFNL